jgi:large subunit ribosomal protein L29
MKIQEIREMSTDELRKRIDEEEKNAVDLQFAHKLKQLSNTAKLKTTRKDIARMKTLLKEREEKEYAGKTVKKEGAEA